MARRPVQVGDSFVRRNGTNSVWVVERIFEYPDMPPHARLCEVGTSRVVTFALNVLESGGEFQFVRQSGEAE